MKEIRHIFKVSVQAIIYNNNDEILLTRRQNTGYMDNYYSLPGGHLEMSETVTSALIRELYEELGLVFKESDLVLFHVVNRHLVDRDYIDFIFKINIDDQLPINKEPIRCSELAWKKIDDLEGTLSYIPSLFLSSETYLTLNEED